MISFYPIEQGNHGMSAFSSQLVSLIKDSRDISLLSTGDFLPFLKNVPSDSLGWKRLLKPDESDSGVGDRRGFVFILAPVEVVSTLYTADWDEETNIFASLPET